MSERPSDADERFDRGVERWFRRRLELDPVRATRLGIHDHDGRLPVGTAEDVADELGLLHATLREMAGFPAEDLSAERRLDRDLVVHDAHLRIWQLERHRRWERCGGGGRAIGEAIFALVNRGVPPAEQRFASIAARLEAAPRYLAELGGRIRDPERRWLQLDLRAAEGLPALLDTVLAVARVERLPSRTVERLERAGDGARRALGEHAGVIRDRLLPGAREAWPIGAEAFDELLRLRELGADADEIAAHAESTLEVARAERERVAAEIDPTLDPEEVADLVRADHPGSWPEALERYRSAIERARDFVADRELASMPPRDELRVVETPSYARSPARLAAYREPSRFDPEPVGLCLVTPPATPSGLRAHNRAAIGQASVHQAYPGHHLQLACAIEARSRARALIDAPEFFEGWASYGEGLLAEAGFDETPTSRWTRLTGEIWHAARAVLDVRLHRGEIGLEQAVGYLVDRVGLERPAAVGELDRYTSTPTYQLSYLWGRRMITELRADEQARLGPAFSLRGFHDALLYGGTMPVAFARRHLERPAAVAWGDR